VVIIPQEGVLSSDFFVLQVKCIETFAKGPLHPMVEMMLLFHQNARQQWDCLTKKETVLYY
jgi:hypothetical protein